MENENKETNVDREYIPPVNPKEKKYRTTIMVLFALLLISVIFSGIQSVYIFRLNTGLEGILSYTRGIKRDTGNTSETQKAPSDMSSKDLPEPWFSLEEAAVISSPGKTRMSTVDIVKKVSPATVSISIVGVDNGKETKIGSGTGFIITEDGYIVTNQHVVVYESAPENSYYAAVLLPDEKYPVRAEIVGSDEQTDIAVLKVNTDRKLPCVTFGDSDTIQAGELAIAIGNAMGTLDDTVTVGIISSPSREIVRKGYQVHIIQTDAAINPGNSGGPLLNSFGEVVGITNAKIVNSTSENLGFAIPINSVKKVIESIINYGMVINRPYLGVTMKAVSSNSYFGAIEGIYIESLIKDGPAENAGLCIGDRIISVDGVEIEEPGDIIKVRDSHEVGDSIDFVVERDGEQITIPLIIGDSADFQE